MSEMKRHYDNVDRLFPNINKQAKFLFVKTNRRYDLDYSMVFRAVDSNIKNTSEEIDDEKNLEQAKKTMLYLIVLIVLLDYWICP